MAFEKSIGAVLFRREGNDILYLILQHPLDSKEEYWNFPKGHVEKGETWEETLRREVKEETGIKSLKIISNFYVSNRYFYRAKGNEKIKRKKSKKGINIFKIVTYYLAKTKIEKIKISDEHIDGTWVGYNEAMKMLTYEQSKKVLKKGNDFLEKIK
jgi:bis(5'-nucleosidyl)-tetraphosphatase